jgi:ABC-type phosphate transport system substrate-binding protein
MRNTSKVYAVAALAGGCLLATAGRANAATPACNSYAHPVYIAGSSASQPLLQALAYQLKQAGSPISIIYESPSSCVGLNDVLTPTSFEATKPVYLDGTTNPATATTCDATNGGTATGSSIDIGASDVFPTTCTEYSNIPALTSSQKDFWGPVQAMVLAVQATSTQASISAEAAYVVFGWSGQSNNTVAPWTDPSQMFIRSPTSGTESMIAKAIGLPPTKWLVTSPLDGGSAQHESGSGALVTALEGASSAEAAIGILSTEYVDQNRSKLKALAFQAIDPNGGDQECGYLPDSDGTHFDKLNVRQGRYGIWGPLHFVTAVDGSGNAQPNPSSGAAAADVQTVISWLNYASTLTSDQTKSMIQAAGAAYVIPPCAMEVTRSDDAAAEASFAPTGMCGCYYEALSAGTPANLGTPTSAYCHACTTAADCSGQGNYTKCNYGFCEVQ